MNVPRLTLIVGNLAQVKRAQEELYCAGFKKAGGYVWRNDDLVCWVVPAHAELEIAPDMKFGAKFVLYPEGGNEGFREYLTQCVKIR